MHRPIEILLVEDSPADARLAREALLEGAVPKRISLVTDGAQAIDFVRRRGQFKNAPRPDLVLLDLNLPKLDGMAVLREIKNDPALRAITVIVLTTSQFPKDVTSAYEASANCYIVKPVDLDQFYRVMHGIEEFWMTLASLPSLGQDPIFSPPPREEEISGEPPPKKKSGAARAHATSRSTRTQRIAFRDGVTFSRRDGIIRRGPPRAGSSLRLSNLP